MMIEFSTRDIPQVDPQLQQLKFVFKAETTFGQHDIEAVVSADDKTLLGSIMPPEIQPNPGILETLTSIADNE